jgi:hypothetical protein
MIDRFSWRPDGVYSHPVKAKSRPTRAGLARPVACRLKLLDDGTISNA